jgi:hypothetical protein
LQANRKPKEGGAHPERNAHFAYINERTKAYQARGQPVISVDTKKKEGVGEFKNGGREWPPMGEPEYVRGYDFQDKELGKAIPYGVYDGTTNTGWVRVGMDYDRRNLLSRRCNNGGGRWVGAPIQRPPTC